MDNNPNSPAFQHYLKFQIHTKLTDIAKESLNIIAEAAKSGRPISYFDSQSYRKRILDRLGDSKREMEACIAKLDIELKKIT